MNKLSGTYTSLVDSYVTCPLELCQIIKQYMGAINIVPIPPPSLNGYGELARNSNVLHIIPLNTTTLILVCHLSADGTFVSNIYLKPPETRKYALVLLQNKTCRVLLSADVMSFSTYCVATLVGESMTLYRFDQQIEGEFELGKYITNFVDLSKFNGSCFVRKKHPRYITMCHDLNFKVDGTYTPETTKRTFIMGRYNLEKPHKIVVYGRYMSPMDSDDTTNTIQFCRGNCVITIDKPELSDYQKNYVVIIGVLVTTRSIFIAYITEDVFKIECYKSTCYETLSTRSSWKTVQLVASAEVKRPHKPLPKYQMSYKPSPFEDDSRYSVTLMGTTLFIRYRFAIKQIFMTEGLDEPRELDDTPEFKSRNETTGEWKAGCPDSESDDDSVSPSDRETYRE